MSVTSRDYDKLISRETASYPDQYGRGIKTGQGIRYTDLRGTFGPLGNIKDNACGAFAVQNVLTLLGARPAFGNIVGCFNKHWYFSTLLGGRMGANPFFVNRMIKKQGFSARCYFYKNRKSGKSMPFTADRHDAYIALYVWKDSRKKMGAHYQALQWKEQGKLAAYNTPDGVFQGFQEFYERAGARMMVVIGYDRKRISA